MLLREYFSTKEPLFCHTYNLALRPP